MGETYNELGNSGSVIEDPDFLFWLEGDEDNKFGRHNGRVTPREVAELIYMFKGVTYGDVKDKVKDEETVIVMKNVEEDSIHKYNAATGDKLE